MKPTPEMEAKGLRAYEQARAFERLRTWRLPLVYGTVPGFLIVIAGFLLLHAGRPWTAAFMFGLSFMMAILGWAQWQQVQRLYAKNIELLAELERTYGAELPWIQVENHFAALEALRRENGGGGRTEEGGNS